VSAAVNSDGERSEEARAAHAFLHSDEGPPRFAHVGDQLYRGGQPSRRHLEALWVLGVRTVINLRREERKLWRAEQQAAEALGMKFFRFPFYGVFGAKEAFLEEILAQMSTGGLYIHCKHGRDRTSLLIALYRVYHEGWDPEVAWQREVLAYGYQPTYFYRKVRSTFDRFVARDRGR
jgi:protein tyrosine/serine phosphatase